MRIQGVDRTYQEKDSLLEDEKKTELDLLVDNTAREVLQGHLPCLETRVDPSPADPEKSRIISRIDGDGNAEAIQDLSEDVKISREDLSKVFIHAAETGTRDKVLALLKRENISAKACGKALFFAAFRGDKVCVVELLKREDISAEDCSSALFSAARWGEVACVAALLEYRDISAEDRGKALYSAAFLGRGACVVALLKHERISKDDFRKARAAAAEFRYRDVIEVFDQYADRYERVGYNCSLIQLCQLSPEG